MCRWMAWMGQSILIDELLFKTQHGIVDQSLHSRMGAETTNGDGFGIGWYGAGEGPAVYHSIAPAWGDENLRELAAHTESPLFLAHVRAAIGSPVQATNCHPFRRGQWLFVHNGFIADFHLLRRDLMLAIDPAHFADVVGSTDSEVVFQLAITLGLESDPVGALEQTIGLIEATAREHGVAAPVQGTFGVSDGESLWAVRYATEGPARSLFASADVDTLKALHPGNPRLQRLSEGDHVIVSEPFADLPGAWQEIPEATAVSVRRGGELVERQFVPAPSREGAARATPYARGAATGRVFGECSTRLAPGHCEGLPRPRCRATWTTSPWILISPRTFSAFILRTSTIRAAPPGWSFAPRLFMNASSTPASDAAPAAAPVAAPTAMPRNGARNSIPISPPQSAPPAAPVPASDVWCSLIFPSSRCSTSARSSSSIRWPSGLIQIRNDVLGGRQVGVGDGDEVAHRFFPSVDCRQRNHGADSS